MIDLRSRERKLIAICGAIVAVALIHLAILSPILNKRAEMEQSISRAHVQLKELKLLQGEYEQIIEETERIKQRVTKQGRGFELFSYLDQTARNLNLMNNLTSMKPSSRSLDDRLVEDIVEVKLEGISLENLVAYLYEIEKTRTGIAIANIRIQPESRLGGGLNVSMMVTSIGSS